MHGFYERIIMADFIDLKTAPYITVAYCMLNIAI